MKQTLFLLIVFSVIQSPLAVIAQESAKAMPVENSDTLASFPGGDKAFTTFIRSKLFTTKQAMAVNIFGDVTVQFVIDEKGLAGDFVILDKLGLGCDEQALKALRQMPPWQPGVINGRRIKSTLQKTIRFDNSLPVSTDEPQVVNNPTRDLPLQFGSAESDLSKYITDNFNYPAGASKKINGVIVLRFAIDYQGRTGDIHIISGISEELDAEAVRMIKRMPAWQPKTQNFRPVPSTKELIIGFKNKKALLQTL